MAILLWLLFMLFLARCVIKGLTLDSPQKYRYTGNRYISSGQYAYRGEVNKFNLPPQNESLPNKITYTKDNDEGKEKAAAEHSYENKLFKNAADVESCIPDNDKDLDYLKSDKFNKENKSKSDNKASKSVSKEMDAPNLNGFDSLSLDLTKAEDDIETDLDVLASCKYDLELQELKEIEYNASLQELS